MTAASTIRLGVLALMAAFLGACMTVADLGGGGSSAPAQQTRFDDGKAAFDHQDIWRVEPGDVSVEGFQSYVLRLDRVPSGLPGGQSYDAAACYLTLDRILYVASTQGNVETVISFVQQAKPTARAGGAEFDQVLIGSETDGLGARLTVFEQGAPLTFNLIQTAESGEEPVRFDGRIATSDSRARVQAALVELNFSKTGFPYFLRCEGPMPLAPRFRQLAADLADGFVAPTER